MLLVVVVVMVVDRLFHTMLCVQHSRPLFVNPAAPLSSLTSNMHVAVGLSYYLGVPIVCLPCALPAALLTQHAAPGRFVQGFADEHPDQSTAKCGQSNGRRRARVREVPAARGGGAVAVWEPVG